MAIKEKLKAQRQHIDDLEKHMYGIPIRRLSKIAHCEAELT